MKWKNLEKCLCYQFTSSNQEAPKGTISLSSAQLLFICIWIGGEMRVGCMMEKVQAIPKNQRTFNNLTIIKKYFQHTFNK